MSRIAQYEAKLKAAERNSVYLEINPNDAINADAARKAAQRR